MVIDTDNLITDVARELGFRVELLGKVGLSQIRTHRIGNEELGHELKWQVEAVSQKVTGLKIANEFMSKETASFASKTKRFEYIHMMAAKKPHSWDNDQNIPLQRMVVLVQVFGYGYAWRKEYLDKAEGADGKVKYQMRLGRRILTS
ncbi:hypothetical protein FRC0028_02304 [Corynebacterium diphtheriae]|nr:hypothetical protein FRC0081_02296 [Corynebacterium diphtheriae]CAB0717000.1 hypothetical protein FRC0028_02304 [Corynebacterium diphtheriae]CAB0746261.1 hypothetical protein FRC0086_02404 [Corynebacterium diphtheriae]CAB0764850.1 hypothetical protein FRC0134_02301 [Corynebacterium diphtheriae]CAB0779552.1 hypothetical protein FRC0174_02299 [Corynebacterium diphtheriae]